MEEDSHQDEVEEPTEIVTVEPFLNFILVDASEHFKTDDEFESKDAIINWCKVVGKKANIVVLIGRSEKARNRLILRCERGGEYQKYSKKLHLPESRILSVKRGKKRSTGTKKCNCPFKLKCVLNPTGKWTLNVVCGMHNHELADTLQGHSYAGRLTKDEEQTVKDLARSGIDARKILTTIKMKDPSNKSALRNIHNYKYKIRQNANLGRSMMQQLMFLMEREKYVHYELIQENDDYIRSLFFAHPDSIRMLKCFHEVIVVDCTYKTNRYKLPLLEIVGTVSTNQTFNVAFCFMENEKEVSYEWAFEKLRSLFDPNYLPNVICSDRDLACMNAIKKVFPQSQNIICIWHIKKNIEANCKHGMCGDIWEQFREDFDTLVAADTEDVFTEWLIEFERKWIKEKQKIDYIRKHWWPYKTNFVSAWINKFMHFGHGSTQRVESAHSKLKSCLYDANGTFEIIFEVIHNMVVLQITDLNDKFERSKTQELHKHNAVICLRYLICHVSQYALDLLRTEVKIAFAEMRNPTSLPCMHGIRKVSGLPCQCEIQRYIELGNKIPLDAVHVHWRQLSMKPHNPETRRKVEIESYLEKLIDKFKNENDDGRFHLVRKIQGLVDPVSIATTPPITMIPGKGRAKKLTKKQMEALRSKERDKSYHEFVREAEISNANPSSQQALWVPPNVSQRDTNGCWRTNRGYRSDNPAARKPFKPSLPSVTAHEPPASLKLMAEKNVADDSNIPLEIPKAEKFDCDVSINLVSGPMQFLTILPRFMQPWISEIHDVLGDGNCGFRAIAHQMQMNDKEGWRAVRNALIEELDFNMDFYKKIFYDFQLTRMSNSLRCFDSPCDRDYWMSMPDTGALIATAFKCVCVSLSTALCVTSLPLRGASPEVHKIVVIGYLPDPYFHFVSVQMCPNFPMPPISTIWDKYHGLECVGWTERYSQRLQQYLEINPPICMASSDAHVID